MPENPPTNVLVTRIAQQTIGEQDCDTSRPGLYPAPCTFKEEYFWRNAFRVYGARIRVVAVLSLDPLLAQVISPENRLVRHDTARTGAEPGVGEYQVYGPVGNGVLRRSDAIKVAIRECSSIDAEDLTWMPCGQQKV